MINRKKIGPPEEYKHREIQATYIGPGFLCTVNGVEIGQSYTNAEAARAAGRLYIDELETAALWG